MKRRRFFSFWLVLVLLASLLLSGCGGESTPASPSDSAEPLPAPILAEDDVTVPSIQSFADYRLEPKGDKYTDGHTVLFYGLDRHDAFTQEYIDLLTERYHFSLRGNAPYREGSGDYFDGAMVYYFDYTGTAPIVGFYDNTTEEFGKVYDVELIVTARKAGYTIEFADGLVWTDTDDRSATFADPVVTPDADYILPSIQSFANYQLEPEGDKDKDGYMILYYDEQRNETFNQEYIDLLTEQYRFSLRGSALYREGIDKYLDGAMVYYLDYTGTESIVGFSDNSTETLGEVHDIELKIVAKKTGFAITFADGLVWTDTDDRSTVFGGSEPQYPSGGGGSDSDWDDDDDDDKPRRCAVCGGDGEVDCNSCGGSGEKDCISCSGKGYTEEYVSTPNYSGSGSSSSTERVRCFDCGGDGEDECYSCRGHGTKDCTSCGGSGER